MNQAAYRALLLRGYPYLRILVDAQGEGAREAADAYAAAGFHERHVPRDVALFSLGLPLDFSEGDIANLVRRTLASPRIEGPRFVLEALIGTRRLVALILSALRDRTDAGKHAFDGAVIEGEFRALGMMLRRLPPDLRRAQTEQLRALAPKVSDDATRAFQIVTGGFASVSALGKRDSRGELSAYDLIFADDDDAPPKVAAALRKLHIDDTVRPNIRLAYLGGDDGLAALCARVLEFSRAFRHIFVEDFAPLDTPTVHAAIARLGE